MRLTNEEKKSIANMEIGQSTIEFDDENRSIYQYKIERSSDNEWTVSKFAIMCLAVKSFITPEEVYKYIQS